MADRAEALGSTTNDPLLLSTACTVHGEVDQLQGRSRAARTWLERGLALAERLDVGPGEFLVDPQVALLGLLASPSASSWLGRASARMRCSAPMPALAIADGRWRGLPQSGTARCSRCGSATPSVWPLLPTRCTRSSTNSRSLTVELRVGGFVAGRTPGWAQPRDAYQRIRERIRRQHAAWDAGGRKRGPGVCDRGLVTRRRPGRRANATRGSAADRRARSGSACICRSCS